MGACRLTLTETALAGLETPLPKAPAGQSTQCQQGDTMLPPDQVLDKKQPARCSCRPTTWLQISSSDKTLPAERPRATAHLNTPLG